MHQVSKNSILLCISVSRSIDTTASHHTHKDNFESQIVGSEANERNREGVGVGWGGGGVEWIERGMKE